MKTGKDVYDDEWFVRGDGCGRTVVIFDEATEMAFNVAQAVTFAAAVLEQAGETELAKMVRESAGT